MIYLLFEEFFSRAGLGLRIGGAGVMSFFLVLLLGPKIIRLLIKKKIGDVPEFDHKTLNEITKHKSNTPTMGGVLIVAAMFISIVIFGNLTNMYIKSGLFALIWLGLLGGVDDWLKLRAAAGHGGRDGLKSWEKFVFQVALAVLLSNFVYRYGRGGLMIDDQIIVPAHSFLHTNIQNDGRSFVPRLRGYNDPCDGRIEQRGESDRRHGWSGGWQFADNHRGISRCLMDGRRCAMG